MWGKAHPCPCELSWVQPVLRSWLPVVSELSPATGREKSKTRWKEERSKCRRAEKEETEGERGRRGRLLAWQSLLLKHKLHTAQTCVCHMAVTPPPPPVFTCNVKKKQNKPDAHIETRTQTHTLLVRRLLVRALVKINRDSAHTVWDFVKSPLIHFIFIFAQFPQRSANLTDSFWVHTKSRGWKTLVTPYIAPLGHF